MYHAKCIQLGSGEMISQKPSVSHPPVVVNLVQPGMQNTLPNEGQCIEFSSSVQDLHGTSSSGTTPANLQRFEL